MTWGVELGADCTCHGPSCTFLPTSLSGEQLLFTNLQAEEEVPAAISDSDKGLSTG